MNTLLLIAAIAGVTGMIILGAAIWTYLDLRRRDHRTAEAAQSDAQSALAEDKVPRAYRGAVRDYFDDLK